MSRFEVDVEVTMTWHFAVDAMNDSQARDIAVGLMNEAVGDPDASTMVVAAQRGVN